jgi:hypothetical protein
MSAHSAIVSDACGGQCLEFQNPLLHRSVGCRILPALGGIMRNLCLVAAIAAVLTPYASPNLLHAETVQVKYRGTVDLKPFACTDVTRSSFIRRVCFDKMNSYMLIDLAGTYYHYCEIDGGTVSTLLAAESIGRFYNSAIKGQFDCRTHRVPNY